MFAAAMPLLYQSLHMYTFPSLSLEHINCDHCIFYLYTALRRMLININGKAFHLLKFQLSKGDALQYESEILNHK